MTWFNWHEPVITAAQGAKAFGIVMVVNLIVLVLFARSKKPSAPDRYEHVDAEGRP